VLTIISTFGLANLAFAADTPPSIPDPFADENDGPPSLELDDNNDDDTPPSLEKDDDDNETDNTTNTNSNGGGAVLLNKKKPSENTKKTDTQLETDKTVIEEYRPSKQNIAQTGPGLAYLGIVGAAVAVRKLRRK